MSFPVARTVIVTIAPILISLIAAITVIPVIPFAVTLTLLLSPPVPVIPTWSSVVVTAAP